jgi:hypothetical protein
MVDQEQSPARTGKSERGDNPTQRKPRKAASMSKRTIRSVGHEEGSR